MSERRHVDLPRLLEVGDACSGSVARLLSDHDFDLRRVYVGSGGDESSEVARQVVAQLEEKGSQVTHGPGLDGRFEEALGLAAEVIRAEATTLIAVGGGRVIDTVKLAAGRTGADLVSVPTTISHDGISSPVASLFAEDGHRHSYAAAMPAGIVVDTTVIAAAPPRTLRAGLGDLVSNLTAILDWRLAARNGRDRFDAYSAMIAENAGRSVLDLEDLESAESHERLAKGLLMSGLAMAAAGTSRPCSGAEHLISHALDARLGEGGPMHGEQVALGTLVSAAAHESALLEALSGLFGRLALPRRPTDVGISDIDFLGAVQAAPGTRPGRYTVLSALDLSDEPARHLLERAFSA
jgi:glycerol-1-phosphate dehydrogenase [NAD(P)+]